MIRRCSRCGEEKPLEQFVKDRSLASGHKGACKACYAKWRRKHYHTPVSLDVEAARNFIAQRVSRQDCGYSSPCWVWQLATEEKGYARSRVPGFTNTMAHVHRVSFELAFGPIRDGLQIDHLCEVTSCVNPDHLEAVTPEENRRRQGNPCARKRMERAA